MTTTISNRLRNSGLALISISFASMFLFFVLHVGLNETAGMWFAGTWTICFWVGLALYLYGRFQYTPQHSGEFMVNINLFLWLAMFGATIAPGMPHHVATWIAVTGMVVAACWQHSTVRGFLKSRKTVPQA